MCLRTDGGETLLQIPGRVERRNHNADRRRGVVHGFAPGTERLDAPTTWSNARSKALLARSHVNSCDHSTAPACRRP